MRRKNIVNDIKISFKVIGCFGLLFAVVAVMMLCARQYVSDQDSMYRQYIETIRETGGLKASIEKLDGYLYHYVAIPSARNNTMAILNQETNSIDQIVQNYKGKKLVPEEKKLISDLDTARATFRLSWAESSLPSAESAATGLPACWPTEAI